MLVYQRVLNSTKHSVSLDLNLFPSELRQSFPNWGRNLARNQCCKGHRIFQRTLALDHKVHPPDKIWQVQTGKRKRSKWVRFNILTFLWRFSCSLLWIFILMRPTISEGPPNIWGRTANRNLSWAVGSKSTWVVLAMELLLSRDFFWGPGFPGGGKWLSPWCHLN